MTQLPYIAIEGVGNTPQEVLDSLIAIEPLLVMMGYNIKNEDWNDRFCVNDSYHKCTWNKSNLHARSDTKGVEYHNHTSCSDIVFKSTEINKLIKYMITNKFIK